jgi:DNA-binding transcriptional regulator YiaG
MVIKVELFFSTEENTCNRWYYLWYAAVMEGNELQQRREALGMSRDEFAKALHTTSVSVWRWENGERGIPAHLPLALETVERNHQGNGQRTARKAATQPTSGSNAALTAAAKAKKRGKK